MDMNLLILLKRFIGVIFLPVMSAKGKSPIEYNYPQLLKYWDYEKNRVNPSNFSINSTARAWWSCPAKQHSINVHYSNHINNFTCFKCSPKKKIYLRDKFPELEEIYSKNNYINFNEIEYINNGYEHYLWKCSNGHEWSRTIYNQAMVNKKCHFCNVGGGISEHLTELPYGIIWDYKNNEKPPKDYPYNFKEAIWLKCLHCDNSFKRNFKEQVVKKRLCLFCSQNFSTGEKELLTLLRRKTNYIIYENYKEIPNIFEVDLFFPELNIAIDYNGEYWHSNKIAIKNGWVTAEEKHKSKIEKCNESSILLLYVWEDDFYKKGDELVNLLVESLHNRDKFKHFNRLVSNRDI